MGHFQQGKEPVQGTAKDLGSRTRRTDDYKGGTFIQWSASGLDPSNGYLKKPKLLLLDEHTAALDPKTAKKVLEITDQIIKEHNLTAMMVTHNMRDAIKHGNRLIMMHEGQIILDINGEDKKKLTVEALLDRFGKVSGEEFANDRALLS